ncbi:hypothetical protein D3C85_1503330 [compost metagenome]
MRCAEYSADRQVRLGESGVGGQDQFFAQVDDTQAAGAENTNTGFFGNLTEALFPGLALGA